MNLQKCLFDFSNDELLNFIDTSVRPYLSSSITKGNIALYIEKNFEKFVEKKDFVITLFMKAKKYKDISNVVRLIRFNNELTTQDSKKIIYEFFNISYQTEKVEIETVIDRINEKRFYELLDYQFLIKEKVCNYVYESIENGNHVNKMIIHMPTGTGKTKTSVHTMISLYQKNYNNGILVWLAHTEELLNQARNAFISAWSVLGNKPIKVIFNDTSKVYDSNAIYFISYQKLISFTKIGYDAYYAFRKNLSICICDEAHKCLAQETYNALDDFMLSFDPNHSKTLLGLTATPGRKYRDSLMEGDNQELALMFDKHIFSIDTNELKVFTNYFNNDVIRNEFSYKDIFKKDNEIIRYFQDRGVLAKIKRIPLDYKNENDDVDFGNIFNKKRTGDYTAQELKIIGDNFIRNKKIIDTLKMLDERNIPTILFACSNEQGQLLSNILTLSGIKNNCIFGDTKSALRRKYLKEFDDGKYNILINNAILTTGFDSPRIKCVFITRPTNSIVLYSQMLGRGLRGKKMGGNDECLLIDIIDNMNKFNDENFAFNYFSVYWR